MDLLHRGGLVMWPLLALSVVVLAVMVERFMFYSGVRLGGPELEKRLLNGVRQGGSETVIEDVRQNAPILEPLVQAVFAADNEQDCEREAAVAVEDVVCGLDQRLGFLSVTGKIAPLLGLLGTIMGMIHTFEKLSSSRGAIDMTMLAEGIWQALLTTASGLALAIPVVLAHQWFIRRRTRIESRLARLANLMLSRRPFSREGAS